MYDLGGTIREITPEKTLARLIPLLLPTFGITRVANITGLDHVNIHTYVAIRPNAKTLSTSQGKGITQSLAKISAIMESIESWHAENVRTPDVVGSYHQLQSTYPLTPLEPFLIGAVGYEDGLDRPISWILAHEIFSNQIIYMPYCLINLDSTHLPKGYESFAPSSNGLAAGNSFTEAICHGLYEVIERDCIYEYLHADADEHQQRHVNIKSIDCPHNQELIYRIQQAGLKIYIWDIANKIGIPAFCVEIDDPDDIRAVGLFAGYGAHLSRNIALSRALTEAVQSRLTFISGSRDDLFPALYKDNVARHANYSNVAKRDFNQCPHVMVPDTFHDCLSLIKHKLQQQQINYAIAFNHTRPDIGIPVVHTFIPALKFDWREHRQVR